MTDTMTFQNIDLSSWDALYIYKGNEVMRKWLHTAPWICMGNWRHKFRHFSILYLITFTSTPFPMRRIGGAEKRNNYYPRLDSKNDSLTIQRITLIQIRLNSCGFLKHISWPIIEIKARTAVAIWKFGYHNNHAPHKCRVLGVKETEIFSMFTNSKPRVSKIKYRGC